MDLPNALQTIICMFILSNTAMRGVGALRGRFKDFYETDNILFVKETTNVELSCSTEAEGTISFISWYREGASSEEMITLFNASRPTTKSNKYVFSESSKTFTINNMGKKDCGTYVFAQTLQSSGRARFLFAFLKVVKIPQGKPICSTNYRYPVIFPDEMKSNFEFNCSTETGNPPLQIDIYADDVILLPDQSGTKNGVTTLSVMTYMTEGSTYRCTVRQYLPSPYNEHYEETCSFGPMHILPAFNISIIPSSAHFTEGDNVTFTCMSNVSGVVKEWKNITRGKYTIANNGENITLSIIHLKPSISGRVTLECRGYYGSRVVTAIAHVKTKRIRLPLLIFGFAIFAIGFACYRRRKSNRRTGQVIGANASEIRCEDKESNLSSQLANDLSPDPSQSLGDKCYLQKVPELYIYDTADTPKNDCDIRNLHVYAGIDS